MTGSEIQRRPPFGQHPVVGERGSDTQRRILDAALAVFDDVGFNDARVELITRIAGCSRPAFYQYFSSKDDVFWKLAGRLGTRMVELSETLQTVSPDAAGVEHLEAWIDDFLTLHQTYAPVFAAFDSASRTNRDLTAGARAFSDRISSAVLTSFGSRPMGPSAATLATGLVGVLNRCGAMSERMLGKRFRPRLIRGLALLFHRIIDGPIEGVNLQPPVRVRIARSPGRVSPQPAPELRPRGQRTRRLLLDAGATVLPLRGFHDARVDDIVSVAGVSHGNFYRYFESKDDLFRVLAAEASAQLIEQLDGLSPTDDTDALTSWVVAWFAAYRRNGGVISVWHELQTVDRDLLRMSDQVATAVLHRLVAVLGERDFGDALVDGLAFLAILERMPYSVMSLQHAHEQDATEAMVIMLQRGLFGAVV